MQIYINKNGQQLGPFEETKVIEMLRNGQLLPSDYGIKQGQQNWQKLESMFPQTVQPVWTPPIVPATPPIQPVQPQQQFNPQPQVAPTKSGSSKGIIFGVIGCGGLLVLGAIGLIGVFIFNKPKSTDISYTTNSSTTNKSSSPTPTPDPYKEDSERRTKFEPREAEFVKLPAKNQLTKEPYIKGKAAFYNRDVKVGEKDPIWLLDNDFAGSSSFDEKVKDIKAKTPEEVETVVLRNCKQYKKGDYIAGGRRIPGYNWSCEITIIDRSISAIIFRKSFQGVLENEVKIRTTDTVIEAYIPYSEIADFLGKLPRK